MADLAEHMIAVMKARNGIGLAANQVGVSVRVFVHALSNAAPEVLIDPVVLHSDGTWAYSEGCLSVQIPGSRSPLVRPKVVRVRATVLDGSVVEIEADELLSRVFQHEIDHLDGIEYVQRLTGCERDRVYKVMRDAGVDVRYIPTVA